METFNEDLNKTAGAVIGGDMAITSEYCTNVERSCFLSLTNWYRLVRYFINTIVARNSKKAL